jgi:hypothetical protein
MTDLAVAVRLNADGTALVNGLKPARTEIDNLKNSAKGASVETTGLGASTRKAATDVGGLGRSAATTTPAIRGTTAAMAEGAVGAGGLRTALQGLTGHLGGAKAGATAGAKSFTLFSAVLGGAFGGAAGIATTAVGLLTDYLFKNRTAVSEVEQVTNSLSDAQSLLGNMFDLASGKIKDQNEFLRLNAELKAASLRADAAALGESSRATLEDAKTQGFWEKTWQAVTVNQQFNDGPLKKILDDFEGRKLSASSAAQNVGQLPDSAFVGVSKGEVLKAIRDGAQAGLNITAAGGIDRSLSSGALDPLFRKADRPTRREPRRTNQQALSDFENELRSHGIEAISDYRSAAEQNRLFSQGLTAADGYKRLSRHQSRQAVDAGLGRENEAGARAAAQAAGLKNFRILKESGGRIHYDWTGHGARGKVDVAGSERVQRKADALKDFGDGAAEKILRLNEQFDRTPRAVDQANASIRETNALMQELRERKPPGFERMISDATKLAPLIRQSLKQPILDLIDAGDRDLALGRARLDNDQNRVEELQLTNQLMSRVGVENEAQLATELARRGISGEQVQNLYQQLDAQRQQSRELQIQNERQANNLSLIRDSYGAARDGIRGLLSGDGVGAGIGTIKRIASSYKDALATELTDKLLGGFLRAQEDKITGVDKVSEAGVRIAAKVDGAAAQIEKSSTSTAVALLKVADAAGKAAGALGSSSKSSDTGLPLPVRAVPAAANLLATVTPAADFVAGALFGAAEKINQGGDEIVAVARTSVNKVVESALRGGLEKIFGAATAGKISKAAVGLFRGAAVGSVVSGTLNSVGIRQSGTGASIGGAVGAQVFKALAPKLFTALGAFGGPIGQVAGALLGGTLGKLFTKAKTGSASLSFDGSGYVSGAVGGNSAALQGKSQSLAGGVGSSLASIADQLGGILTGAGRVSLGYDKKGRVVVDPTGAGRTKGAGVQNFGKDGEVAATAFATANVIADGAIEGLSAKVASALKSSTDIDRALSEAVKVQSLEDLLAGFGGSSRKVFIDFERQAKDRFRVASKYGFDLVKLEAENGKARAKLLEGSIEQATGGLKALLESLTTGEKAPGTLEDRRQALLAKAATLTPLAGSDADAASKLADVLAQIEQVSLEANGTAGAQYAGDRSFVKSTAQLIIDQATAEITAAQNLARSTAGTDATSTDALLAASNKSLTGIYGLLDENGAQNAQIIAALNAMRAAGGGNFVIDPAAIARSIGGGIFG